MKPEDARSERSSAPAAGDPDAHPAEAGGLWESFVSRGNLVEALRRVAQNAGAAGIDGMSTRELRPWLREHWSQVRSQLAAGTYQPQPVRRVMIPKPSGGVRMLGVRMLGVRMLGVPTVVDRLVCQALAQVLVPVFDPHFHPHSFGFARGYADDGRIYVGSERAGQRVMRSVTGYLEQRLKLKVNRQKSVVDKASKRALLGFRSHRRERDGTVRVLVDKKARQRAKARLRQLDQPPVGRRDGAADR